MIRIWGSCLLVVFLGLSPAWAIFEDLGAGARPLGMGNAFVATADDSNALRVNVAGTGHIPSPVLSFTQSRPFGGLVVENHLAGVLPLKHIGSFGVSVSQLSEDNQVYKEQALLLSYARAWTPRFATGIAVKRLSTSFDTSNESVAANAYFNERSSASAISMDLGALLMFVPGLQFGVSVGNVVPADLGLQEEETLPLQVRFGLAYDFSGIAASAQQPALQEILRATHIGTQISLGEGRRIHAGIESWLSDSMAVRIGYISHRQVHQAAQLTVGASLKFLMRFQVDYAFQWFSEDLADNTGHRISTSLLF